MSRPRLSAAALVLALSSAALADPTAADVARAKKAFAEAATLEAAEHWQEAATKLQEALAVKETPGLHYHLAHCLEQLGKLREGHAEYERAYAMIRAGVKAPDVEVLLLEARTRVELKLARVMVMVPSDARDADVSVGGEKTPPGSAVWVEPGEQLVHVSAPGRREYEALVSVTAGERRVIAAVLPLISAPPAPPSSAPSATPTQAAAPVAAPHDAARDTTADDGASARTWALVGEASFTVVALGVGVGFLLAKSGASDRASSATSAIDAAAPGDAAACSRAGFSARSSCDELSTALADRAADQRWSTIGFVGAGVGVVALAGTWLLWPKPQTDARAGGVRFAAAMTPDGAALGVSGSFCF